MSKLYVQSSASVLGYSDALAGSDAGIGGSISGSLFCDGYSRLVGGLSLSASLQSGSGFQVSQSFDRGVNWSLLSACQTLAAGASPFSYEIVGDAVMVKLSNGSSANTIRTLWRALPIQAPDKVSWSSGSVVVSSGSTVVTNQVSASISGGSVAMLAGENHFGEVGGRTTVISACVTRPNDSASYVAGDMWANATTNGTLLRFPSCARKDNGSGIIAQVLCVNSASLATQPQINLWLFDNVVTSPSDNAPFALTDAEIEYTLGVTELSTWFAGGSTLNSLAQVRNVDIPFVCQSACNSLWGIPVVMNSCSPAAQQNLQFRLGILQD